MMSLRNEIKQVVEQCKDLYGIHVPYFRLREEILPLAPFDPVAQNICDRLKELRIKGLIEEKRYAIESYTKVYGNEILCDGLLDYLMARKNNDNLARYLYDKIQYVNRQIDQLNEE